MDANRTSPAYELKDEPARFCFPPANRVSSRKRAGTHPICIRFLLFGAKPSNQSEPPGNPMPTRLRIATAFMVRLDAARERLADHWQRPVVVAVSVMRMMQSAIHQIIHVVAVRNGGVAAVGAVNMLPVVAFGSQRAFVRIDIADRNDVFIHVIAVWMVQMAVMEIIHVPFVHDGDVPAILAVDVGMVRVRFAGMGFIHRLLSLVCVFMCMPPLSKRLNQSGDGHGKKCFCKQLA